MAKHKSFTVNTKVEHYFCPPPVSLQQAAPTGTPGGDTTFRRQYFHSTRANIGHGDLMGVWLYANYGEGKALSNCRIVTGTLDTASAQILAVGSLAEKLYIVKPTGLT